MSEVIFDDRRDAGQRLAQRLRQGTSAKMRNVIVVALPRGGVPVGFEVARAFHAPLEIAIVRKIGAPGNPEYGIGAVAEDGTLWVNDVAAAEAGATPEIIAETAGNEMREIRRRVTRLRGDRPPMDLRGKNIILVDDGLATGVSARVAARYLRRQRPLSLTLAIPVGSAETIQRLKEEVDEVVCLATPEDFFAVGSWYRDFAQLTDEEVLSYMSTPHNEERDLPPEISQIRITHELIELPGDLVVPSKAKGTVIFAHGSGSGRRSPRNMQVARVLNDSGMATLLFDLLTPLEAMDRDNVFDIPLLSERLNLATHWVRRHRKLSSLPIGYFGASTGAAAALQSAVELEPDVAAVVSRGGRADLAGSALSGVTAPTLLIVGGDDDVVIELNRQALRTLPNAKLVIVPRATHLFEEPGALEKVADYAVDWFGRYFAKESPHVAA